MTYYDLKYFFIRDDNIRKNVLKKRFLNEIHLKTFNF